jgi:hypothetical protein
MGRVIAQRNVTTDAITKHPNEYTIAASMLELLSVNLRALLRFYEQDLDNSFHLFGGAMPSKNLSLVVGVDVDHNVGRRQGVRDALFERIGKVVGPHQRPVVG